jgi:mannobiose 2-epimerase
MVDIKNGGFYGQVTGQDQLVPDAPKAIILNSRILWTFSAAYHQLGSEDYRSVATRAFDYISKYFIDHQYGGVYWTLDHKGAPVDTKKQVYAQAFAIYALSAFHQATRNQQALELAISIYELIERHSFDQRQNGYLEAFDRQWQLLDDLRLSEKDANEAKTMNTHLHLLEAYTNLYQVWPDAELYRQLKNLVNLFLQKFISETLGFHLFFDENWNLKSQIQSYGHDIEGGWLLQRAAEVLGDPQLIVECEQAAVSLTNTALRGLDTDGGLMYEGDIDGITDSDKHWWPQAEALVGLINAWQITGDWKYFQLAHQNWDFIQRYLVDPSGEWHWKVNQAGSLDYQEDKAGPWKAPYHNGRAMLELMQRLG